MSEGSADLVHGCIAGNQGPWFTHDPDPAVYNSLDRVLAAGCSVWKQLGGCISQDPLAVLVKGSSPHGVTTNPPFCVTLKKENEN